MQRLSAGDARLLVQAMGTFIDSSPDGRYIAYTTEKSGTDTVAVSGRCYVIPAVGGGPRLVTPEFRARPGRLRDPGLPDIVPGDSSRRRRPRWPPTDVENPRPVISSLLPASARGAALNSEGNQLVLVLGTRDDVGGIWTVPFDSRMRPRLGRRAGCYWVWGIASASAVADGGSDGRWHEPTHPSTFCRCR